MVKSAFAKTLFRTYFQNKGRFLANFFTVMVSVALTAGLGSLPRALAPAFLDQYREGNAPDLIVKGKAATGLSDTLVEQIKAQENVEGVQTFYSFDVAEENGTYNRYVILDYETANIAKPVVVSGTWPSTRGQIALELPNKNRRQYALNDVLTLSGFRMFAGKEATISCIVDSPLYNSVAKERAELEDESKKEYVDAIFYLEKNTLPAFLQGLCNSCYVRLATHHDYLTKSYYNEMEGAKARFLKSLGEDNVAVLTLEETTSYGLYRNYNDKIQNISLLFPWFFLALCALINYVTVSRLIKDERAALSVYSSVGINHLAVASKYAIFIGSSVASGALFGYLLGSPLLPVVVAPAYGAVFSIGHAAANFYAPVGIITAIALALLSLLIAFLSSLSYLREEPSELFREKAPAPGRKIWLERIPFLWNLIRFSYKSAFRNIFRQRKNMILTSFAIGGATLLVFLSFSLLNVSYSMEADELFSDVASSMGAISAVIIVLAIGMAIPTIYSLANMNIEDRKRELATLKVLGYHDIECLGYTFREIMIVALSSTILSLPISVLVTDLALRYIGFGSIGDVRWWAYLLSVFIVLLSVLAVNLLLYPRIKRIDMNTSLKSIE